jgi:hypothetical protein
VIGKTDIYRPARDADVGFHIGFAVYGYPRKKLRIQNAGGRSRYKIQLDRDAPKRLQVGESVN